MKVTCFLNSTGFLLSALSVITKLSCMFSTLSIKCLKQKKQTHISRYQSVLLLSQDPRQFVARQQKDMETNHPLYGCAAASELKPVTKHTVSGLLWKPLERKCRQALFITTMELSPSHEFIFMETCSQYKNKNKSKPQ